MDYFDVEVPGGRTACKDNECPCYGGTSFGRGEGFLFISKANIDFRRDCKTVTQLNAKVEGITQQARRKYQSAIIDVSAGYPVIMCEVGARRHAIDLDVAQADARHWWQTGKVPFRQTPAARQPSAPGQPVGIFMSPDVDPSGDHRIESVAISPDGRRAVSAGWDGIVRLWNLDTRTLLKELSGHYGFVRSVAFLGDGKRIISAGSDRTLRVWDSDSGRQVFQLKKHSFTVHKVAASADGNVALSISGDQTARLWDLKAGRHLRTLGGSFWGKLDEGILVDQIAISPSGAQALTSGRSLQLWNLANGKLIHRFPVPVREAVFLPDGKTAIADCGLAIKLFDLVSLEMGREIVSGSSDGFKRMSVSANGRWLCFQTRSGRAQMVELTTGKLAWQLDGQLDDINSLAISADGKRIIAGSDDIAIGFWQV